MAGGNPGLQTQCIYKVILVTLYLKGCGCA